MNLFLRHRNLLLVLLTVAGVYLTVDDVTSRVPFLTLAALTFYIGAALFIAYQFGTGRKSLRVTETEDESKPAKLSGPDANTIERLEAELREERQLVAALTSEIHPSQFTD